MTVDQALELLGRHGLLDGAIEVDHYGRDAEELAGIKALHEWNETAYTRAAAKASPASPATRGTGVERLFQAAGA